jgi:actin-related protein 8
MRFYKLRVTPNATKIASTFNEQFKPEKIAEHNDYQTEWIDSSCPDEVLIGEKVRKFLYKNPSGILYHHPGLASRRPRYLKLPGEMAYLRL